MSGIFNLPPLNLSKNKIVQVSGSKVWHMGQFLELGYQRVSERE
jgi:hypothetical protein